MVKTMKFYKTILFSLLIITQISAQNKVGTTARILQFVQKTRFLVWSKCWTESGVVETFVDGNGYLENIFVTHF